MENSKEPTEIISARIGISLIDNIDEFITLHHSDDMRTRSDFARKAFETFLLQQNVMSLPTLISVRKQAAKQVERLLSDLKQITYADPSENELFYDHCLIFLEENRSRLSKTDIQKIEKVMEDLKSTYRLPISGQLK